MTILEPKWKSWIVETTSPLFTPEQCQKIIDAGRRQQPQKAQVGMANQVVVLTRIKEQQLYLGYLLKKCQRCMMIFIHLYKEQI